VFKITVAYKDFNDNQRNEDLYFHMMAPELAELEFNTAFDGSLSDYIKEAMTSGEGRKIYTFFKMLVVNSYGRRSEDGSEFVKRAEFTEKFLNSPAWEQFFLWLTDDPKNAETYWNGIFPESMKEKVKELEAAQAVTDKKDLKDLSKEELMELFNKKMAEKSAEG
jgi:hypothetical protein